MQLIKHVKNDLFKWPSRHGWPGKTFNKDQKNAVGNLTVGCDGQEIGVGGWEWDVVLLNVSCFCRNRVT